MLQPKLHSEMHNNCYWNIALFVTAFNSSAPSGTYMRQWTGSSLIQVKACRLFGAKQLPEPMPAYCQLDSTLGNKFQWNLNRNSTISNKKIHLKMSSAKMTAILSRGRWINSPRSFLYQVVVCHLFGTMSSPKQCPPHDDVIKWKHFPRYWPF